MLYKNNGNCFRLLETIRIKTGNSSHMHYPPIPYTQHLPNTTQCGTNRKHSLKWTIPPTNDSACPVACGLKLQTQCGATASNHDCTFSLSSFNTHQATRSFLPFPTGSLPCVTLMNIPSHLTSLSSTNTPHFSQLQESRTKDMNSLWFRSQHFKMPPSSALFLQEHLYSPLGHKLFFHQACTWRCRRAEVLEASYYWST